MFNRKSDYALNKKNRTSIIYIDAYDNITQLTAKDFSSEKEFRKWKNWMNMKTHTEEKKDHIHRNRTVSLDYLRELAGSSSGAHDELDESDHRSTALIGLLVQQIRSALSEKQFRRLWMYFVEEMTMEEIGEREGISHQNVSKSIGAAMKKMKKIRKSFPQAEKQGAEIPQNRR